MLRLNEFIEVIEGVNDPAIFKAVFLAGGPGSGKSFIVGKTALTAFGMRVVNSDDAFEAALKKAGLTTSPEDIFSVKGQEIRKSAVATTGKKLDLLIKGRLGLVIDGTGKNWEKIKDQKVMLDKLGYDTAMLFVNTTEEEALNRNRKRERQLPDAEVSKMWKDTQKHIGNYQILFGRQNMIIVDNTSSDPKDIARETMRSYKTFSKWVKQEPYSSKAKDWIKQEREKARRD